MEICLLYRNIPQCTALFFTVLVLYSRVGSTTHYFMCLENFTSHDIVACIVENNRNEVGWFVHEFQNFLIGPSVCFHTGQHSLLVHSYAPSIRSHTARKIIYVYSFSENCAASVPISTSTVYICERFIYSQDRSTYFPAAELADWSWKYINLSQIYECRNWGTELYNSFLEITVSFLGIYRWEPDSYFRFSPVLHLQCIEGNKGFDQILSQWESQKNRFAFIYFGKIQFLPPCI
jgi:hypothetical protein